MPFKFGFPMSCVNQILFLCTGNYYRSRFAEILFNYHAQREQLGWRAVSRGLNICVQNPGPISVHTLRRLDDLGIPVPLELRFPIPAESVDFDSSSHIVAVKESEHRRLVESNFPLYRHQVEYWNIHDLDCSHPEEALDELERHIGGLLERFSIRVR